MTSLKVLPAVATALSFSMLASSSARAQSSALPPHARFQQSSPVVQNILRADALAHSLTGAPNLESRSAVSVAVGSFFEDGANALVTGYAVGTGGFLSIQQGTTVLPREHELAGRSPFSAQTGVIALSVRPDLLKAADLNGDGHQDLVAAARGGNAFQVLTGDGRGGFNPHPAISVNGTVQSLAAWRNSDGQHRIAVGVCGQGCSVQIFHPNGTLQAVIAIDDRIDILETRRLNGSGTEDILAGGAAHLVLIDGRTAGRTAGTSAPGSVTLPVSGAVAAAAGNFVYDRRGYIQIAVLTADGTLHTFARAGIESTFAANHLPPGQRHAAQLAARKNSVDLSTLRWTEVETLASVALPAANPILVRTRISGSGMDDLLAMNMASGQTVTVRHPIVVSPKDSGTADAGTVQVRSAVVEPEPGLPGPVAAALPVRLSQNAGFGLVTADGQATPKIAALTALHTFTVNTTSDVSQGGISAQIASCTSGSGTCSLRAAIQAANNESSALQAGGHADTINVPAGTYTLGNNGVADQYNDIEYHIEMYAPINLIGTAGAATTLITSANNDIVLAFNSANTNAENNLQPPLDFYMSGIQLTGGTNKNVDDGVSANYAGLMSADTGAQGNITLSNCFFTKGTVPNGWGGALYITDESIMGGQGNGVFELDNSTVSSNVAGFDGGGVYVFVNVPIALTGDTFTGNSLNAAITSPNDAGTYGYGQGGGLYWDTVDQLYNAQQGPAPAYEPYIKGTTFTGNLAPNDPHHTGQSGGGGAFLSAGIDITNSIFTSNQTGSGGSIGGQGGGLLLGSYYSASLLAGNQFLNNAAKDGGGAWVKNYSGGTTITFQYNLVHGNTASDGGGRSGLGISPDRSNAAAFASGTIDARDNFWGCNGAATGTGCDTASLSPAGGTPIKLSPYAAVTAALTPDGTGNYPDGSTVTLTGGITTDSSGTTLTNLQAFEGIGTAENIDINGAVESSGTFATGNPSATAAISAPVNTAGPGTASFTIENATVNLTFTAEPQPPVANDQAVSAAYATPLNITLTATGTGPLSYTAVTSPTHGTLTGTAPTLTYTPNAGFVGADSFTFTASNGGGPGNTATVGIAVGKAPATISLVAPALLNRGTAATLTATLTIPGGGPTPTTQIGFYYGGTHLIGTASITLTSPNTYTATLNAVDIPGGKQTLNASYTGDGQYQDTTSTGQNVVVNQNNLWVGNSNDTTTAYDPIGSPYLASPESSGGSGGQAIDQSGNVWSTQGSQLALYANDGTLLASGLGTGVLNKTAGIVVDSNGYIWVLNNGSGTVAQFLNDGSSVGGSPFASAFLSAPTGIAIDISGNLWIANTGSVVELLGAAVPTIPLAAGVATSAPAAKP